MIWNLILLFLSKQKIKISIGNEVINVLRNLNSVHVQQDSISSENKNCGIRKVSQWIGIPVNLIFINKVDSELIQLILLEWYIRNSKLYIGRAVIFCRRYNFLSNESQKTCLQQKTFFFYLLESLHQLSQT